MLARLLSLRLDDILKSESIIVHVLVGGAGKFKIPVISNCVNHLSSMLFSVRTTNVFQGFRKFRFVVSAMSQEAGVSTFRVERDSFGDINVPATKYYGANTARSLIHFSIGDSSERMPVRMTRDSKVEVLRSESIIEPNQTAPNH